LLEPAQRFVALLLAGVALCLPLTAQTPDQSQDPTAPAQSAAPRKRTTPYIAIRNVAAVHDQQGAGVEITSTVAVVPSITKLDGPPRLVIDLPGTVNRVSRNRILPVQAGDIKTFKSASYNRIRPSPAYPLI